MTVLSTDREQQRSELQLNAKDWLEMEKAFVDTDTFQKLEFNGFEMRFVPMEDQVYSLLLSKDGIDVFHFMWAEVDGLVNITHRIVNPEYRGQGIGKKVMEMIIDRLQRKVDREEKSLHLMMETNQLSVVGLGVRSGMQITQGKEVYEQVIKKSGDFQMDSVSTVVRDPNNYAQWFRLSLALKPQPKMLKPLQWRVRENVEQVLATVA